MASVAFVTLGCKVNQFETEVMEGLFKKAGYALVPHGEVADVYVINTCSVTSLSDKKSRQLIRRMQRQNPHAIIAVTGCYAQIAPEEVKALTGVRVVLGTANRRFIVEYVEQAMRENSRIVDGLTDVMQASEFEDIPLWEMPSRTRAFLKIQEGCTNFCSYCIIPYTRGPLRSRPLASVKSEAQKLIDNGFKEIVLTGIHLGAYGKDLPDDAAGAGVDLAAAAKVILELEGLRSLRLGSLESIELSPELLRLLREHPKFSHHVHLPLQAGSDDVLKRMNRHYNRAEFAALLAKVREAVPKIAISTDVIVGFPGETEEMFADSLEYIRGLKFSRMHVFPYSQRSGTPAAMMPNQVPEPVKKERAHRMQMLAEEMAAEYRQGYVGTVQRVLFETNTAGESDGLTDTYIRVYTDDAVILGEIYQVRIDRLYRDGLYGKTIKMV